jgi:hypothetical protein
MEYQSCKTNKIFLWRSTNYLKSKRRQTTKILLSMERQSGLISTGTAKKLQAQEDTGI